MNQNIIVAKLCENRDKPKLHCDGKCYLAKKIKIAEDEEKKNASTVQKAQEIQLFSNQLINFSFCQPVKLLLSEWSSFIFLIKSSKNALSVFHPPQF